MADSKLLGRIRKVNLLRQMVTDGCMSSRQVLEEAERLLLDRMIRIRYRNAARRLLVVPALMRPRREWTGI